MKPRPANQLDSRARRLFPGVGILVYRPYNKFSGHNGCNCKRDGKNRLFKKETLRDIHLRKLLGIARNGELLR